MISRPICQLSLKPRPRECFNLKLLRASYNVPIFSNESRSCASDARVSRDAEVQEKRKRFLEIEKKYEELLQFDKLTKDERVIHVLHAEAVKKGHFSYDDPVTGEKVITRLRHFLKGKCCGKSCRHCIYDHSGVLDEERKARAWFNSSFWQYDDSLENLSTELEDHEVITYGRGPYPRKYAQSANTSMFRISSSNHCKPQH